MEEATDLNLLYKNLDILDRQLKDLNISFRTRYVPKSQKVDFKNKLDTKVNTRDQLLRQGLIYRAKRYRLKIAVEAAQAYNRFKPPHQTVGDAVTFAIAQATGLQVQEKGVCSIMKYISINNCCWLETWLRSVKLKGLLRRFYQLPTKFISLWTFLHCYLFHKSQNIWNFNISLALYS